MTRAKHKKRHELLHRALDELCADWASHQPRGKTFTNSTIMELIQWSAAQTVKPDGSRPDSFGQSSQSPLKLEGIEGTLEQFGIKKP